MIKIKDLFIGDFPITQYFAQNPKMYAQFGLKGHNGIDFGTPNGTVLVCCFPKAQVITVKYDKSGYGHHIKLWDEEQKVAAIYGHMDVIKVMEGQQLIFGQELGTSDNTGFSTGPHLHFGIAETDEAGNRLNTNNGYAGWLNPFDKSRFAWEVENIRKVRQPPQEEPTDEQKLIKRIVKHLKERGYFDEGLLREAIGYHELEEIHQQEVDGKDREIDRLLNQIEKADSLSREKTVLLKDEANRIRDDLTLLITKL